MKKRVGILTSGGDCPGLNATIRGAAKALYQRFGDEVEIVGIQNGYDGLIKGEWREMQQYEFSGILTVGGTILGTKRTPFKMMTVVEDDKVDKVAAMKKTYKDAKLDCLLCLATARVFYTITFNANGGEGSMEPQRFEVGVDTALNTNAFTRESYNFIGWNTAADGSGATYADEGAILELTGDMTLYAQWQFWNGWFTDVNGKQYYKDGELQKTGWTVIDGNTYYLDTGTGYAATGIATLIPDGATEEARCVFDAEGVFQSDVTGVYSVGADTYWLNSGIIEEEAGLKRVVKENGEVNYYYFAVQKNLEERDGLTLSAAVKSTVLNGKDCWLHKTKDRKSVV